MPDALRAPRLGKAQSGAASAASGRAGLERRDGERSSSRSSGAIAGELGVESRVILRTARELAGVVKRNPLADVADDPKRYRSASSRPSRSRRRARARAADVAPEQVAVSGREIYAWHPRASSARRS